MSAYVSLGALPREFVELTVRSLKFSGNGEGYGKFVEKRGLVPTGPSVVLTRGLSSPGLTISMGIAPGMLTAASDLTTQHFCG